MRDHDRGRGAGDAGHAVMLGDPVAGEAEAFGMAREIGGIGERARDGAAFDDGDEIEQGICGHVRKMGVPFGVSKKIVRAETRRTRRG